MFERENHQSQDLIEEGTPGYHKTVGRIVEKVTPPNLDSEISILLQKKILSRLSSDEDARLGELSENTPFFEFVPPMKTVHREINSQNENCLLVAKELNGCMAVLIFSETVDGKRRVVLSHQPPDLASDGYFQELGSLVEQNMDGAQRTHAVVYGSKKRGESTVGKTADWLKRFSSKGDITVDDPLFYQEGEDKNHMGLLIVQISGKQEIPATFSTLQIPKNVVLPSL